MIKSLSYITKQHETNNLDFIDGEILMVLMIESILAAACCRGFR